jgi:D-beta-D-heptose 7-phosphate kinase / D-beta-D-heptose 1-phosphate adenosyltransferase
MQHKVLFDLLDSFHRARVLVLGDVMLDRFVYGSVERISPEAPIPVMAVKHSVDMPGGAANVARNAATLGAQVTLLGVVGEDAAAQDLRLQLGRVPSITPCLIGDTSRPTTLKTRHVADRQQILRSDIESREPLSSDTAARILAEYRAAIQSADIVILSDYGKGTLSDQVVREAITVARQEIKRILVDPKSRTFLRYAGATVLTPNRHELQLACGTECVTDEQIVTGARGLLEQQICEVMVVTRGKDGMSIIGRDGVPTHLRTVAREVFDVSGAGDTAVAAMSLALAGGANFVDAARLANVAAGIVVGKYGTAEVTAGEIEATLEQGERSIESNKNFTLEAVMQLVGSWREQGLRVAFTNGCFDLLHPGHVSLLEFARGAADKLIVGLNSDLSVRQLKGPGRPVQSEVARATVLASLKAVDAVVIFGEDTPIKLIEALQPDVLVKGADYTVGTVVGADLVLSRGGQVLLAELVPAQSTTNTLKRVARMAEDHR